MENANGNGQSETVEKEEELRTHWKRKKSRKKNEIKSWTKYKQTTKK